MFRRMSLFITSCILLCFQFNSVLAQEYVVEPKDNLKITFWEDKELDTETKVLLNGNIVLPIVGTIKASGLTPQQLSAAIVKKMSLYGKVISNVNIEIIEYASKRIYITGEVQSPGKLSFEVMPNLWEILLEAGGPTSSAMLGNVAIIRRDQGGKVEKADISAAIEKGELNTLPKIRPGDTIHVPSSDESGNKAPSPITKSQVVYIFGAVGSPGPHFLEKNTDILEAIVKAGGPTSQAKLSDVSYISKSNANPVATKINLQEYIDKSIPNAIKVKPGDSIYVPQQEKKGSSIVDTLVRVLAGAAITSVVVAVIQK